MQKFFHLIAGDNRRATFGPEFTSLHYKDEIMGLAFSRMIEKTFFIISSAVYRERLQPGQKREPVDRKTPGSGDATTRLQQQFQEIANGSGSR
jgi:hypothetical protein